MLSWASYAEKSVSLLESRDYSGVANLMRQNFQLRKRIFGEKALGAATLRMIEIAESRGFAAKFTGSGGAILCLNPQILELPQDQFELSRTAFGNEGFGFEKVALHEASKSWEDF